ncbi:MAG: DegT/DnrJ/EryC1/StrS family aminotransferase, partial [Anaerolineales bacterium]|nr:DegT/DnrJ/EryC1/StrS family aminotransferase [Candidatus Desulfolinea nitratireducens]
MKIPITKPYFDDDEFSLVRQSLETGWVVQGPRVAEFERLLSDYSKIPHTLATTSCTTALHLGLVALGIGSGDEIIVPAFTFVASANVIEYQGARPVFCDIDLSTFNIDVTQIESKITERTKAIMPVSLFGLSADMDPILELARQYNLYVIEDAACAVGGWYKGHHAGALADVGALSFHPRKLIVTGEGGMLLTGNQALAEKMRSLRDHGATVSDLQRHQGKKSYIMPEYDMVGFNYRMTDIQGAIGVAQMRKFEYLVSRRSEIARRYDDALAELNWLRTPHTPDEYIHGYQSYVCLFAPVEPTMENVEALHTQRNNLMDWLEEKDIATRQGTQAVHALGYFRKKYNLKAGDYPNAYIADRLSLALPLYAQMTTDEQDYVVQNL